MGTLAVDASFDAIIARAGRINPPTLQRLTQAPHRIAVRRVAIAGARRFVEDLALALQVGLLLQCRSPVADAFGRSRLGRDHGLAMGTLPVDAGFDAIIARAGAGILPADSVG